VEAVQEGQVGKSAAPTVFTAKCFFLGRNNRGKMNRGIESHKSCAVLYRQSSSEFQGLAARHFAIDRQIQAALKRVVSGGQLSVVSRE